MRVIQVRTKTLWAAPTATFALLALLFVSGCDNTVDSLEELPPLEVADLDEDAGNWRMIVLSGPDQITVASPASVDSDEYKAELDAIKTAQQNITKEQRAAIAYWSSGGVLRWNQIMRELVAKYNLPPAPRVDGTYPAPDPENPFADPQFPFANPPYAVRAYSYVSVAQYEALKAAWYWKYKFNRPSPARVDAGILELMPVTDLPAFPSEDAVLSGVTAEMLKLLFPGSVELITRKAAEQRTAALVSGKASSSDIAAGLALGKAIASAVVARAGVDGMRTAGGNPAQWKALADSCEARGEIPWKSLEVPPRPPMLSSFGYVRAWMLTPAELVLERPPDPPSTSSEQMKEELEEVKRTVKNLTREQLAIAQRWNDGVSTYTPPGHWNDIAAEYISDARMSEVRAARTFAMLNMAMHDAGVACWDTKFHYFNPRPTQLDPSIQTVIGLPNFPSYPSGHSTFSAAASAVLSYFFPEATSQFEAMKEEAAISRLYGGIHYRSDIEIGKDHGERIGGYTVRFAQADGAD